MRTYYSILYFLFLLIILGSFASMAQNNYGLTIIGLCCFGFAVTFVVMGLYRIKKYGFVSAALSVVEFALLSLLSVLFAFRAYLVHFRSVELVLLTVAGSLLLFYLAKLYRVFPQASQLDRRLGWITAIFYGSTCMFLISMIFAPFVPQVSEVMGGLGFLLLIGFSGVAILSGKKLEIQGQKTGVLHYVWSLRDQGFLLLVAFGLISVYVGLTTLDLIPPIHYGTMPGRYIQLVQEAESGKDQRTGGQYRHEIYKENLDQFLKKHGTKRDE